ncbi:MAG: hypothetical protein AABO41_06195 [Acidobacteriota bacterium]
MLSPKDFPLLRSWGTPTPSTPISDIGPTGTVWRATEILVLSSSAAVPQSSEFLSFTLGDFPNSAYQVLRLIPVVVEMDEGCIVASFNEANIHASGDTINQAVANLRSYIGDVFDEFSELGADALGPGPKREFATLQSYIRRRNA